MRYCAGSSWQRCSTRNSAEKLLDGGFGPLATFSARIDVSYSLGWIGPESHHDLHVLRKVRSEFAHAHMPVTFSDTKVEALCEKLRLPKALPEYVVTGRDKFQFAASIIAFRVDHYRKQATKAL